MSRSHYIRLLEHGLASERIAWRIDTGDRARSRRLAVGAASFPTSGVPMFGGRLIRAPRACGATARSFAWRPFGGATRRSQERRVGKECVRACVSRGSPEL